MFDLKLHHIGCATRNIEKELKTFQMLGYSQCSDFFCDEIQKIKGVFISALNQPCIELLENLSSDGPLTSHIIKGNKFYHFAYETTDIHKDLERFVCDFKAKIIIPITKATFFENICFMVLPNMMIVELVELKKV